MTERFITFDDGTRVRGDTDVELVRNAELHIRAAYPQIAGQLSREEILAMAVQAKGGNDGDGAGDKRDDDRRV